MIQLGHSIRKLRTYRGLKQSELAELSDVSVSFLCHVEANRREPSPRLVRKIAEQLGVSVEVLIWDALDPPEELTETESEVFTLAKSVTSKYIDQLNDAKYRDKTT